MENWLLYMLVFIFGYSTCRTFYFIRANRISLSLIKLSHMIYLSATIKALESLYAVRAKIKMSDIEPLTPDEVFEEEIKTLKENSVAYLLQLHPKFYRDVLTLKQLVN